MSKIKIPDWLSILGGGICGLSLLAQFIVWQPVIGSIALVLIFLLAFSIYREMGRKERELARQGFHVEWVSPGVLRAEPDDIAIVYHDNRGEISFFGKMEGHRSIVTIPDSVAWEKKVPTWAKDERETIIKKICEAHSNVLIAAFTILK